jgi:ribosomal protein S18 acetylase RimI-like enzyme
MEVTLISPADLEATKGELLEVYRGAFAGWPHYEGEDAVAAFADSLTRHAQREGFRAAVAQGGGHLVGFAYGYTGGPGQWWYDLVAPALPTNERARWMDDYFEFVELAVAPDQQRQGVGSRLHDALVGGLPHRTALLSTEDLDTPARRLYLRCGWLTVLSDFAFPGSSISRVVLGLDLTHRKS